MKALFTAGSVCLSAVAVSGALAHTFATAPASGLLPVGADAEIEPPQG